MPTMNPDGMEESITNMELQLCNGNLGRYNSNQRDLNRNFPDKIVPKNQNHIQPETRLTVLLIFFFLHR